MNIQIEFQEAIKKLEKKIHENFLCGKLKDVQVIRYLERKGENLYQRIKKYGNLDEETFKKAKLLRFLNPFGCTEKFDVFRNYFDEKLDTLGHNKTEKGEERYYIALHEHPLRYLDISLTVSQLPPSHTQEWHWHEGKEEHTITLTPKYAIDLEREHFAPPFHRINISESSPHTLRAYENIFSPDITVKSCEMRLARTHKNKHSKKKGIKIFSPETVDNDFSLEFYHIYTLEKNREKVRVNIKVLPQGKFDLFSEDFSVVHVFPWKYNQYSLSMRSQKYSIQGKIEDKNDKKVFYGGDVIVLRKGRFTLTNFTEGTQILEVKKL